MSLSARIILVSTAGLIFLGACSNTRSTSSENTLSTPQSANSTHTPTAILSSESNKRKNVEISISTTSSTHSTPTEIGQRHSFSNQNKQTLETGQYRLELVTVQAGDGIHLDFHLKQSDNHATISEAKVIAQIYLPDGTQKSLNLDYDTASKHYSTVLPTTLPGEYKVTILADIDGQTVNARYHFMQ